MHHTLFICSTDGHLGCFHSVAIVSNAAISVGCGYPFELVFLFPLGKYLGEHLLNHQVILFLNFEEALDCVPDGLHQFTFSPTCRSAPLPNQWASFVQRQICIQKLQD